MQFILDEIVYKFGIPLRIVSDQGTEIPDKNHPTIKPLGITRLTTSSYSPRSNGEIERRWKTMHDFLVRNTSDFHDLTKLLPVFLFACNLAPCKSTGHSPFYLMMGYTPASACVYRRFCPKPSKITYSQDDPSTREEERLNILKEVRISLKQRAIYRKAQFDKSATQKEPKVGDQVLIRVQPGLLQRKGINKKIQPRFRPDSTGRPFTVLQVNKGYCHLLDTSSDKYFTHNNNNILILPQGPLRLHPLPVPYTMPP